MNSKSDNNTADLQFDVSVGDTLQFQMKQQDEVQKLYIKLIGYLPGHSLIVTAPRQDGNLVLVKKGSVATVRLLSGCRVLGFESAVIAVNGDPYPHLHIACPVTTGKIVIRQAQRINGSLIMSVQSENINGRACKPLPAKTTDISTAGALVESSIELGGEGELITIKARVNISGVNEYLTIPAIIRNVRYGRNKSSGRSYYYHGVEFQILEQHDSILLHGFVYEQMMAVN